MAAPQLESSNLRALSIVSPLSGRCNNRLGHPLGSLLPAIVSTY